jgi:hypothetical protein
MPGMPFTEVDGRSVGGDEEGLKIKKRAVD